MYDSIVIKQKADSISAPWFVRINGTYGFRSLEQVWLRRAELVTFKTVEEAREFMQDRTVKRFFTPAAQIYDMNIVDHGHQLEVRMVLLV